ncbi:MAG: hypothetical protein J5822_00455 [Eubacteriaceae bacterium]|nr:hypothetical protein [Eubacteriaceae bacterium]
MRIITADLENARITDEVFERDSFSSPGGTGLAAEYLAQRSLAAGPGQFPLVFATGLFAGTRLTSSNILSMGWVDPSGALRTPVFGGDAGRRLTDHGVKLLSFEGSAPDWVYLHVDAQGQVSLRDARSLAGRGTAALAERLRELHGKRSSVICIGPCGTDLFGTSCLMVTDADPSVPPRQAAGAGMGRAMGERRLLAVVTEHSPRPFSVSFTPGENERFGELCRVINSAIAEDSLTGSKLPLFGPLPGAQAPASGWSALLGYRNDTAPSSASNWRDKIISSGGYCAVPCMPGCTVRCSGRIPGSDGRSSPAAVDCGTALDFGSATGIFDISAISRIERVCADHGCDLSMTGRILGELVKTGVLGFGDSRGALRILSGMFSEDSPFREMFAGPSQDDTGDPVIESPLSRGYEPRSAEERAPLCFMCIYPWRAVSASPEAAGAFGELCSLMGWPCGDAASDAEELLRKSEGKIASLLSR